MTPAAQLAAAIELLELNEGSKRPSDRVAADYFKARRYIGAKDRRAVAERVFGVLRASARLDWWIRHLGARPTARLRLIARLSLVEGRSAAELSAAFGGSRYAPPPLAEEEARVAARLEGRTLDHPEQPDAVRLEVPAWLWPRLAASLGAAAERELSALLLPAAVDLRVNLLKADREAARQALAREGIESEPGRWSPWCLRIDGRKPVAASAAFRQGLVEVQDEGSQLVALLADAHPGMQVCDFCAGAGGKTLALAAAMENRGRLIACDVLPGRLERSAVRLRRAGVHNVTRRPLTGERDPWVKRHKASFDRVLVDAPCSGSGTWRRNPEARWHLSESGLEDLRGLQARILASAARLVAPGGRLVYATCSLLAEENERQVEGFLESNPAFSTLPLAPLWGSLGQGQPPASGPFLRLTPARHGTDGFFLAVLERQRP